MFVWRKASLHCDSIELNAKKINSKTILPFGRLFMKAQEQCQGAKELWIRVIDKQEVVQIMNKLARIDMLQNPMQAFREEIENEWRCAKPKRKAEVHV